MVFQPVTHAGRHTAFDPLQRLTNADMIHGLVDQCPDWFRTSDFFPVPCCCPTCRSITYLLADDNDVLPIPRLLPMEDYLDYLTNRALPDPSLRGVLEGLWSASAMPGTDAMVERLSAALASLGLPDGSARLQVPRWRPARPAASTSPTPSPSWRPRRS